MILVICYLHMIINTFPPPPPLDFNRTEFKYKDVNDLLSISLPEVNSDVSHHINHTVENEEASPPKLKKGRNSKIISYNPHYKTVNKIPDSAIEIIEKHAEDQGVPPVEFLMLLTNDSVFAGTLMIKLNMSVSGICLIKYVCQ